MRALFVLFTVAVTVVVIAACGEDFKDCYAEDLVSCSCPNKAEGYKRCNPAGNYVGVACVCDGTTPGIDAGHDAGTCTREAGLDASFQKYFDDCASNDDCASCRCEAFEQRSICTTGCTTVDQCAAPAAGCTNRGFCRP